MQLARDYSIQVYCEFYPSHEAGTHLSTDHHRIGVFYHQYDTRSRLAPFESVHLPKSGRLPLSYWRHMRNAEARFRQSQGLERTRFAEFGDYEAAYGGTSTPFRWARAYQPSGLSMLPPVFTAVATPLSDPAGYVNNMLNAFSRFYDPNDALTRDDWNRYVDLTGSRLGAQYSTGFGPNGDSDVLGAMLNSRAQKLTPDDLQASMRLLAQKVVERSVIDAKTPAELGITAEGKKHDIDYYDDFIGRVLDVRRFYLQTGDILPEDEMFAGFDSKQDANTDVSQIPQSTKVVFSPAEKANVFLMIQRLREVVKDTSPKTPNDVDVVLRLMKDLDTQIGNRKPTEPERKFKFQLAQRYAQLTSQGFLKSRSDVSKELAGYEKAQVGLVQRRADNNREILAQNLEVNEAEVRVAAAEAAAVATAVGSAARRIANKKLNDERTIRRAAVLKKDALLKEMTNIDGEESQTVSELEKMAASLNTATENVVTPASVRRALATKKNSDDYQRAVSLVTIDLVEKELASMNFKDQTQGRKDVTDAISIIEKVRGQLPAASIYELSRVSGRGSLPFALKSTSSSLAVVDIIDTGKYKPETQAAIRQLLR